MLTKYAGQKTATCLSEHTNAQANMQSPHTDQIKANLQLV